MLLQSKLVPTVQTRKTKGHLNIGTHIWVCNSDYHSPSSHSCFIWYLYTIHRYLFIFVHILESCGISCRPKISGQIRSISIHLFIFFWERIVAQINHDFCIIDQHLFIVLFYICRDQRLMFCVVLLAS